MRSYMDPWFITPTLQKVEALERSIKLNTTSGNSRTISQWEMEVVNQIASIQIRKRPDTSLLSVLKSTADLCTFIIVREDLSRSKWKHAQIIHQELSSPLTYQAQQATHKTRESLFLSLTTLLVWKSETLMLKHPLLPKVNPLICTCTKRESASIGDLPMLTIRKVYIEWSTRTTSYSKRKRRSTLTHSSVCKNYSELNSVSKQLTTIQLLI